MSDDTRNESGQRAILNYEGQEFDVPVEVAENIQDVLLGIDLLNGRHWYTLHGDTHAVKLWFTANTAVTIAYPAGYKTPVGRVNYVHTALEVAARMQLGLGPK